MSACYFVFRYNGSITNYHVSKEIIVQKIKFLHKKLLVLINYLRNFF